MLSATQTLYFDACNFSKRPRQITKAMRVSTL